MIIMKKLKYGENFQNVIQRPKVNIYYCKYGSSRLAQCGIATKLQFVRENSAVICEAQ
jgi:hypothetical protein